MKKENNSVISLDNAGTTVTGGTEILTGELSGASDSFTQTILDLDIILSAGETLTFAVQAGFSSTFNGSLLWRELF